MFAAKMLEHVHNSQSYFRSSLAVFCGSSFRIRDLLLRSGKFFNITAGLFWFLEQGADADHDFRLVNGPCQRISEIYENRKF